MYKCNRIVSTQREQTKYTYVQYRSDARYKANVFAFSCKRVCLLVQTHLTMYLPQCTSVFARGVQTHLIYTSLIYTLHLICTVHVSHFMFSTDFSGWDTGNSLQGTTCRHGNSGCGLPDAEILARRPDQMDS